MAYTWLRRGIAALAVGAVDLPAQEPAGPEAQRENLRVFVDCDQCEFDYLRTEMPWVAYVRDRTVADVHILVTQIGTGGGGSEYTINLLGIESFAALSDTIRIVTEPGATDDAVREQLTRAIQLGLVPYVLRTPQGSRLRLTIDDPEDESQGGQPGVSDPWNAWVFEIAADGSVEQEEQQRELDAEASFDATRVTERWKIGMSADVELTRDRREFEEDDTLRVVKTVREEYGIGAVVVRSLGAHWGMGAQATLGSSTFENTRLAVRAAPAVEYSVWPYAEATRRQLTFQYSVGISSFEYEEETIFDRMSEIRPSQSFIVGYDVRQPWGSGDAELETAGFLDDFTQYRVVLDGRLEIRLFRGLSLDLGGSASLLRDQLAITKRGATPEEVLLELRALRTDYRYNMSVGFRYTFGSIFNSVVNPRFGGGAGQILP